MATPRKQLGASEFLDALHSFSIEMEEEILTMSQEQVRARLAEEGIDLGAQKGDLASRMKQFRTQRRLTDARERRLAEEQRNTEPISNSALSNDEMRAEIMRRLGSLSTIQGAPVQAYFNRFREAVDEDLPGLLEDLEFLEEQNEEGARGG